MGHPTRSREDQAPTREFGLNTRDEAGDFRESLTIMSDDGVMGLIDRSRSMIGVFVILTEVTFFVLLVFLVLRWGLNRWIATAFYKN